jgi:hypothetical protein
MATANAFADVSIELGEEWNSTSALVHRLQRERGATCSWVAARAANSVSVMKRTEMQLLVADFRKRTNACLVALSKPPPDLSDELRVIREQADAMTASEGSENSQGLLCQPPVEQARRFATIFSAYTSRVKALLDKSFAKNGNRCMLALLCASKWFALTRHKQRDGRGDSSRVPRSNRYNNCLTGSFLPILQCALYYRTPERAIWPAAGLHLLTLLHVG